MKKVLLVTKREQAKNPVSRSFSRVFQRLMLISLFTLVSGMTAFAQTKTVTGTVVDASNVPVIGASVIIEGTTRGTSTDANGAFTLNNVPANANLQINFMGYKPVVIPVGNRNAFEIILEEDRTTLDEIVVVGYGTMRRSDVTGSLSRVTEKEIKERPVTDALQALQGKAAGVDITSRSRPGELGEIRIRGNRSLKANNDPLYVVDGLPLVAGSMADINPGDIESIEVLKDASATAIYGSRAANGVVLISTKRGQSGRTSINYDGSISFDRIHNLTDWMGSGQLLDWERSEYINGGRYNGAYGDNPDPARDLELFMDSQLYMRRILATAYQMNPDGTPVLQNGVPGYDASKLFDQNWTDLVSRTGISHNHQVSVSAGTEKSNIYFSLGYLDQKSPMKDQDYERFTANMSGSVTPAKWLKISSTMNARYSIQNYGMLNNDGNGGAKDSYGQALELKPYAPAYDEDGNILNPGQGNGPSQNNVLVNMANGHNENRVYSFSNVTNAEVTILPWLKYQLRVGAQINHARNGSFYDKDFTNPIGAKPQASVPLTGYNRNKTDFSYTIENILFANKTWNQHTIGLTLMQSAQKERNENLWVRQDKLLYSSALWYGLGSNDAGSKPHGYGSGLTEKALASYMVRANYSFMNRYLLTATGRWDGSSVLAVGNKWDFFPSVAVAWKMEEEEFVKRVHWINQLKLRVGYGVTGNQAVNAYQTTGSLLSANQVFNNTQVTGAKGEVMPNYNLGWEKTSQTNIGLDFAVLNQRISGSLEYYVANTSDLLMERTIPAITGYVKILSNIGKTRNKGFEITLNTVNVRAGDFTWTTDFNWSKNKEEIVELVNGKEDMPGDGWYIGQPISAIRDSKVDRLWQNTPEDLRLMSIYKAVNGYVYIPGQVKLVDQQEMIEVAPGTEGSKTYMLDSGETVTLMDNGFGKINQDDDKVILGSRRPDWTAGMTNTFTYKNWQFNFFIHARVGGMYYGLMQTYGRRVENNVWSPTNPNGKYPQPNNRTGLTKHTDLMNWTKATIYSVRNIALSYNFPKNILDKVNLTNGSIYVQVLNPFIFGSDLIKAGINPDDVKGWGTNATGGQSNNTILTRSYVIGVRFGF